MQPAVIATLISSLVSLAGVIASVYMSRRERDATIEQAGVSSSLRINEAAVVSLKHYAAAVERARIACWHIRACVLHASSGGVGRAAVLRVAHDSANLQKTFRRSLEVIETSEVAWADAKSDVPPGMLDYVRVLRHAAARESSALTRLVFALIERAEESEHCTGSDLNDAVVAIDRAAEAVLLQLDRLFQVLLSAIWSVTGQLIV
jgi:hypothetical protein